MEDDSSSPSKSECDRVANTDQLGVDLEAPIAALQKLAETAAYVAQTPIALVTLVTEDRQSIIANVGLAHVNETCRQASFCAQTLYGDPLFVVENALEDHRFAQNPLVAGNPHIRAYAGHAMETEQGRRLGALCVMDNRPRSFAPDVLRQLAALSDVACAILVGHRDRKKLLDHLAHEQTKQTALKELAEQDPLTNLLNQATFRTKVTEILRKTPSAQYWFALIDVDQFKYINDQMGHTFGDHYLVEVAKAISTTLGHDAILCRIGGDEFGALLPPHSKTDCLHKIEAMRLRIRRMAMEMGHSHLGHVSVGLSSRPGEAEGNYERFYQQADIALSAAKDSGRNKATFYSNDLDAVYNTRAQRSAFAKALEQGHIEPFFQPKVDLANGQIVSFEMLVRWRDPKRGLIEPGYFSKVLTDRATAPELTYKMICSAIEHQDLWRNQGAPSVRLAINLTAHDLSDTQFVDDLDWRIKEADLQWSDFTFEVTETVIMGQPDGEIYRTMERMRAKGAEVSLDDFGTGFAGLAHLRDWPIDSVKIDRAFVQGMATNPKDDMIVATIISLAHRLDLEVIAEGIESAEVARRLFELGCDRGQGFYYSRPVDAKTAFDALMANANSLENHKETGWHADKSA